ncbi:MAG: hypothetical protein JW894_16260 [Bacteroidales bacterium]|nr:hypothetical protein [Bacteroidales bacterium]
MKKLLFLFAALLVVGLAIAFIASSENDQITKESKSLIIEKGEKADFMAFKCGEESEDQEKCGEGEESKEKCGEGEETEEEKCGEGEETEEEKCGEGESEEEE